MTHDNPKRNPDFDTAVDALRSDVPDSREIQRAGARVWSRLQATDIIVDVPQIRGCADIRQLLPAYATGQLTPSRALLVKDHLHECVACREVAKSGSNRQVVWEMPNPAGSRWSMPQFAMAAAAILVVVASSLLLASYFQSPAGMRARVQSVKGTIYRVSAHGDQPIGPGTELAEGELVRTAGGAHAFVQLRDGSIVEMNERSEFSVSATRRNTTVHLDEGRIIVQAAHRRTGHLYVLTPDATVSVTGTVFAVNAGMKGSRVSVIEGAVLVAYKQTEDLLHSGDQVNTSANLSTTPVSEEIAWSDNLDQHLALLAEFAKLQKKFEQIPTPGLRYSSDVLGKLPSNTVFYASVPNLGNALSEANRIFQDQLQQSPILRAWWTAGHRNDGSLTVEQMVEKIHGLSQFVGDEIVLAGFAGPMGGENNAVIIAPIKAPGLESFLQAEFTSLPAPTGAPNTGLRIVSADNLASLPDTASHEMTSVVGEHFVLFSSSVAMLRLINAQLNSSAGGLEQTAFGQRLATAYQQGAGLLLAVDLRQIIANSQARVTDTRQQARFYSTGFSDADYLIVEHRDLSGTPDNRAVLSFSGARHGIASWLAAPNPTGSLEFVSANAGVAVSFLTKSPATMLDDVLQMAGNDPEAQQHFAEANAKLNLDIRNDVAAALGGDVTLALDGPVLPKPSWKVIVQVYDSTRLQNSIEKLVGVINAEAAAHGRPGIQLNAADTDDRKFYTLTSADSNGLTEVDYTYADGYLVAAPSRALLINAINTKQRGDSLARSSEFLGLLPKDAHVNFSAVMYQNLAPLLQPLAGQLSSQQMQTLQQLAADSKPTVICAYAGDDRIELASGSRLLPFDLNSVGLAALLGNKQGTSQPK